jgi:hypothetical protein
VLLKRSCHCTLLWCKAENGEQLPIAYGRYNGPAAQVMQKHRHKCIISNRNQVGRHGLYPRHYYGIFVTPKSTQNTETKRQLGAVPILLLALSALTTSAYSSLGVLQGLNPRPQLLRASVYRSATSAVGYIRNAPLPRVPILQSTSSETRHQVNTIPDYYKGTYVVPTYNSPRRIVERAAFAFSPAWHTIAINN